MKLINSVYFTAVIDANVLFPVVIRDYLLWLSIYQLFTPKWTNKILDEFRTVFRAKGIDASERRIEDMVATMNKACPFALVDNYEHLMDSLDLPDIDDRHVVAAAIKCNADCIVTHNLKDFPSNYLNSMGLEVVEPDAFIADIVDLAPTKCCDAFRAMVLTKRKPPYEEKDYLNILRNNGLNQTSDELEKYLKFSA